MCLGILEITYLLNYNIYKNEAGKIVMNLTQTPNPQGRDQATNQNQTNLDASPADNCVLNSTSLNTDTIECAQAEDISPVDLKPLNRSKELFASYPALAEIEDPSWDKAIQCSDVMDIPANQVVYDGHNRCNTFVLLLKGTVRVYHIAPDGREITLYRVTPGDLCVLSLTSLLNNRYYNVLAKTETATVALCISEPSFREVMGKSEKFRDFVLSTLSERLCDLMFLVQDTVFQTLQVRLACVLVRMFALANGDKVNTTHQALAQELGTTREVISRILKDFEHKETIKITRGHIEVLSFEGLERLSHPTQQ